MKQAELPERIEGASPSLHWPIERVRRDRQERMEDVVLMEEPLEILINGRSIAVLMRMPGREKELAAGFCVSEGYVKRVGDILVIHHCGLGLPSPDEDPDDDVPESRNRVEMTVKEACLRMPQGPDVLRLIRSGCGAADVTGMRETLPVVPEGFSADSGIILGLGKSMRNLQNFHHQTGGTHSAAIFNSGGEAVTLAEDIGRHNAVDKAIGHCLIRRIPLQDKILVTSGRASYEMSTKAIRVGLPIAATISAPTSLAVQLAQDHGLTLIGYLRGGRMNLYTHGGRVRRA